MPCSGVLTMLILLLRTNSGSFAESCGNPLMMRGFRGLSWFGGYSGSAFTR